MELRQQILNLQPWHYNFILGGLSTKEITDNKEIIIHELDDGPFSDCCRRIGLRRGCRLLDVGCNAGLRMFQALKNFPGCTVEGFDGRKLWLDQCRLVQEIKGLDFPIHQCSVDQWLAENDKRYEITLLSGILYHLPDPIHVLLEFAKRTHVGLYINSNVVMNMRREGWVTWKYEDVRHPLIGLTGRVLYPTPNIFRYHLQDDWEIVYRVMQDPQWTDDPRIKRLVIGFKRK